MLQLLRCLAQRIRSDERREHDARVVATVQRLSDDDILSGSLGSGGTDERAHNGVTLPCLLASQRSALIPHYPSSRLVNVTR